MSISCITCKHLLILLVRGNPKFYYSYIILNACDVTRRFSDGDVADFVPPQTLSLDITGICKVYAPTSQLSFSMSANLSESSVLMYGSSPFTTIGIPVLLFIHDIVNVLVVLPRFDKNPYSISQDRIHRCRSSVERRCWSVNLAIHIKSRFRGTEDERGHDIPLMITDCTLPTDGYGIRDIVSTTFSVRSARILRRRGIPTSGVNVISPIVNLNYRNWKWRHCMRNVLVHLFHNSYSTSTIQAASLQRVSQNPNLSLPNFKQERPPTFIIMRRSVSSLWLLLI